MPDNALARLRNARRIPGPRPRHARRLTRALTGTVARIVAVVAALCALALAPSALATTTASVAPASTVPGMATPCWATHYGAEIPPGSYTASGEIFDANALTAATSLSLSPQLPFGSMVTVTNTANGQSVTVRINDRGSFAATASQPFCIDLTDGAFQRIGAISPDPGHFVVNVDTTSATTTGGTTGGTTTGGTGGTSPVGAVHGLAGKCVDVAGSSTADGAAVQLYDCNGTAAQTWTISSDGTIRALGKCLDITSGSTADGAKIQLWTCNASGAQKWQAQSGNLLVNAQSGKCLDATGNSSANGTRLQIWTCYSSPNQQWTLPT
jgi:hypothetical protein